VVGTFARQLVQPTKKERSPVDDTPADKARSELASFRASQEHRKRWYRQHVAALPPGDPIAPNARELHGQLAARADKPLKQRFFEILRNSPRNPPLEDLANSLTNAIFEPKTWNQVWDIPSLTPLESEFKQNLQWPRYFESLVQTLVREELERTERFSREVLFNVKVARQESLETVDQEHDVLLMNRSGTLVSLDAKTASSEAKDLNSRILQFERTSGKLARFLVVIPLFTEDLELNECSAIRTIPFALDRVKQSFLVLSNEKAPFYLAPPDRPEAPPRRVDRGTPGAVECKPLESLFRLGRHGQLEELAEARPGALVALVERLHAPTAPQGRERFVAEVELLEQEPVRLRERPQRLLEDAGDLGLQQQGLGRAVVGAIVQRLLEGDLARVVAASGLAPGGDREVGHRRAGLHVAGDEAAHQIQREILGDVLGVGPREARPTEGLHEDLRDAAGERVAASVAGLFNERGFDPRRHRGDTSHENLPEAARAVRRGRSGRG
jgi:hypothetical protein